MKNAVITILSKTAAAGLNYFAPGNGHVAGGKTRIGLFWATGLSICWILVALTFAFGNPGVIVWAWLFVHVFATVLALGAAVHAFFSTNELKLSTFATSSGVAVLLVSLLGFMSLRYSAKRYVDTYKVSSESMLPSIPINSEIIIQKANKEFQKYDLVLLKYPSDSKGSMHLGRIALGPGDEFNGNFEKFSALIEDQVKSKLVGGKNLPEGHFLILTDSFEADQVVHHDSRLDGLISTNFIVGKAIGAWIFANHKTSQNSYFTGLDGGNPLNLENQCTSGNELSCNLITKLKAFSSK